jgi:hypothetical protein
MITVRRSDTGSFVLIHEPSQTVMVGDDLDATYARMEAHLRDHPSARSASHPPPAATTRRWAWLVGVGVLALLPFLWLVVLHYTLGRLVDELREQPQAAATEDVQALRSELEALRQVVSRVEDQLGQARDSEPRQGREAPPQRPVAKGAVSDEDDDPGGNGDESATDDGTDDGPDDDTPDDDEADDAKAPKPTATPSSREVRVPEGKQP